jgi:YbbR domain-containing protein
LIRRWVNDLGLMLLALVLAVVIWIVAVQEENPIEKGEFQDAIPIEIRNQPEGTTFRPEVFTESVHLTIRAPQSSWRDLRADKFTAWIDLEGREAGEYEVAVRAECIDDNVRIVELRPANVPVRLRTESSRRVPVNVSVYGTAAMGFEMKTSEGEMIIEPSFVTVTGPESIVEQVTRATVDLDLRDRKETFVGTRRVVARLADDTPNTFVTIEPQTVQITIPVVQKIGSNEVAVRAVTTGTVASGYWVRDIAIEPNVVTLIGDPEVVSEIYGFVETLPLDISGATGDVVERMPLKLPEQVSPLGVQGVKVTVYVEAQQGTLTILREPVIRGLSTNLVASISPKEVAVTLTGPRPRLGTLTDEDVYVYVDLVDRGAGAHRIDLTYLVPEGLEVITLSPEVVEVEIRPAPPTPTPTSTSTPTPTATPTPTGTLTETHEISGTASITITVTPTSTKEPGDNITPVPTPTVAGLVATPPSPTPAVMPTATAQKEED